MPPLACWRKRQRRRARSELKHTDPEKSSRNAKDSVAGGIACNRQPPFCSKPAMQSRSAVGFMIRSSADHPTFLAWVVLLMQSTLTLSFSVNCWPIEVPATYAWPYMKQEAGMEYCSGTCTT